MRTNPIEDKKGLGNGTRRVCLAACVTMLMALATGLRAGPGVDRSELGTGGTLTNPNILFIFLDDLGYGDISCYNPKSKIRTPAIDQLAKQGLSFMNAHTAAAICGPSRYGLLTGRYPWRRSGPSSMDNGPKFGDVAIENGRMTLASLLKTKGFNTAQIGKWGLRNNYSAILKAGKDPGSEGSRAVWDFSEGRRLLGPGLFGFNYTWDLPHLFPAPGTKTIGNSKHLFENGRPVHPDLEVYDPHRWLPDGGMKAVEFIETYGGVRQNSAFGIDRSKPFFLYWDTPAPHLPHTPNKEFVGKSGIGPYGDFVLEIDHYIGRILEALDRMKLTDKTLVFISSDNGPENCCYELARETAHYSMGELRGAKRDNWEGGHRVPLIVRWPGVVAPGTRSDALVCLTDMLATFAAITGQQLPATAGEDSENILPLLLGQTPAKPIRDHVIHHTFNKRFAIRQGDWVFVDYRTGSAQNEPQWFREKLGVRPHNAPGELFNLKDDPRQTTNLYEQHPEKVMELKSLLKHDREKDHSSR